MDAERILEFWFDRDRKDWFAKNPELDAEISRRFLALHEQAARGALDRWLDGARSCLALILVLDQFPRNMFRGTARAFATDARARAATLHGLEQGFDLELAPSERMFVYLPLEHSESLADQERCCELMQALEAFPETKEIPEWARRHRDVIARFGRFPHRNAALGRQSTAEELEYLRQPGSGF